MRTIAFIVMSLLLASSAFAFLEVALQRQQNELKIKYTEIAQKSKQIKTCQNDILKYKYNTTVITQMCYHKDLAFTVESLIGDVNFNYEVAAIAIDLHSPISWLKSSKCLSCPEETTVPTFKAAQNLTCTNSCLFDSTQSSYIITNKYRQNKRGSIASNNMYLYGEYILSKFSFLAYDPKKKKSMFRYIEEQLRKDTFEKYEDLITFPSLKLLGAEKMIGYNNYPADGAIGLGLNKIYKGDTKIEQNTDIMEALSSSVQQIDNRIFGIYINEIGDIFKDYVLILGGINDKYSHKNLEDIQYVTVNQETSYYWSLPLTELSFNVPSAKVNTQGLSEDFNVIKPKKQNAILSLSTSFIALPKDELNQLITIINRYGESNCKIVDLTYFAIYCTNFHTETLQLMEISFSFQGGAKLVLDYKQLQRQCNVDDNYQKENRDDNDCLLNIQLSPTDNIILGEPFLKKHYTIFDQEQMRVGFLPAADNTYWRKEFYQPPSFIKYLIRIVIAVFTLGMCFIVCISQVTRFCKWFRRKWREEDSAHYSEKVSFARHKDEISYDDIELSMREQAMNELKKQQFEDTNDFANTQFQEDSSSHIEIRDFEDNQNFNKNTDFPSIPQPRGAQQADLIEVEQPQAFDHGFNFVQANNQPNNNSNTQNNNQNTNNNNGFEQHEDISISLDDGNQPKTNNNNF
ncbi:hypothetical protein ABPG74_003264 [Tetrahymena malaccensis]